jgi:hypothetical protein
MSDDSSATDQPSKQAGDTAGEVWTIEDYRAELRVAQRDFFQIQVDIRAGHIDLAKMVAVSAAKRTFLALRGRIPPIRLVDFDAPANPTVTSTEKP